MRIFATFIVLAGSAMAQPAFDVASVKPDASETGVDRINISRGSLIIRNVSLRRLISQAYGIPDSREYLLAGPDWLDSERFDISAKYPLATPDPDVLLMLQGLLTERFDLAVLACHSDQALSLLTDASERERDILGAVTYQPNEAVLHTDAGLLPTRRAAWAAWNAFIARDRDAPCTVSYCMNLLQGLDSPEPFVVTLNRTHAIDPAKVLRRMQYHHPVYTHAAVAAQRRRAEIQGVNRTWFAGAYWGWGFHEDGMRSAVEVATAFGIRWGIHAAAPDQVAGKAA